MNSFILMAKIISNPELRYTSDTQKEVTQMLVEFEGGRTYTVGSIVEQAGKFYRVTTQHVAGDTFDESNFASLTKLTLA